MAARFRNRGGSDRRRGGGWGVRRTERCRCADAVIEPNDISAETQQIAIGKDDWCDKTLPVEQRAKPGVAIFHDKGSIPTTGDPGVFGFQIP